MTYQDWTNYETWAVKLWLNNEEPSYRHWNEQARFVASEEGYEANRGRYSGVLDNDRDNLASVVLAEQIKEYHEETLPHVEGFAADLLNAAFEEVNWREIADSLLESAKEEGK